MTFISIGLYCARSTQRINNEGVYISRQLIRLDCLDHSDAHNTSNHPQSPARRIVSYAYTSSIVYKHVIRNSL